MRGHTLTQNQLPAKSCQLKAANHHNVAACQQI